MMYLYFLIMYVISTGMMWLWIHLSHNKNGVNHGCSIGARDLFITFTPFMNTLMFCIAWISTWPLERDLNCNSIFKIKK